MKSILAILALALLSSCGSNATVATYRTTNDHGASHSKVWGYNKNTEIIRKGEASQRFEIRHGDCGVDGSWSDCDNDRRRIERLLYQTDSEKENGITWYAWSLYLPEDFKELHPANTALGQVKIVGYREPLWIINARKKGIKIDFDASRQRCRLIKFEDAIGKWTDFMMRVDYDSKYELDKNKSYADVYVNGEQVECNINKPILTKQVLANKRAMHTEINFRYGIYNSYVSRWLDEWGSKSLISSGFSDYHQDSGMIVNSIANKPWEFDWGIKLPTQVVYYDEVRIGPTRESVDINLNKAAD